MCASALYIMASALPFTSSWLVSVGWLAVAGYRTVSISSLRSGILKNRCFADPISMAP